jgi:hypothetical protein
MRNIFIAIPPAIAMLTAALLIACAAPRAFYTPPDPYPKTVSKVFPHPRNVVYDRICGALVDRGAPIVYMNPGGIIIFNARSNPADYIDCGKNEAGLITRTQINGLEGRVGIVLAEQARGTATSAEVAVRYTVFRADGNAIQFSTNESGRFADSGIICRSTYQMEKDVLTLIESSLD